MGNAIRHDDEGVEEGKTYTPFHLRVDALQRQIRRLFRFFPDLLGTLGDDGDGYCFCGSSVGFL